MSTSSQSLHMTSHAALSALNSGSCDRDGKAVCDGFVNERAIAAPISATPDVTTSSEFRSSQEQLSYEPAAEKEVDP